MVELEKNSLVFSFPEVYPDARLTVDFQRTLRIPDDGKSYPLPPGIDRFTLRHVDDFADKVPPKWIEHGGAMLPMYQSEAMWIYFDSSLVSDPWVQYPFAIKIAAGKINAVSGEPWSDGLHAEPQDYVVSPGQPWLDGFCVTKGQIRQFVAMPLGAGYTAEEQLTKHAEHGGLQIVVYPMKKEAFERRRPEFEMPKIRFRAANFSMEMGLAPGGLMHQEVFKDKYGVSEWDTEHGSRCFVHIVNSMVWRAITDEEPPSIRFTATQYEECGLPWFEYYDENSTPLEGSEALADLDSVAELGQRQGDVPLPENESVTPTNIVELRAGLSRDQVREGRF